MELTPIRSPNRAAAVVVRRFQHALDPTESMVLESWPDYPRIRGTIGNPCRYGATSVATVANAAHRQYVVGQTPPSFGKQSCAIISKPSIGTKRRRRRRLPKDVIAKTSAKYVEAFELLTGGKLK